jgi:hypothetical protein
MRENDRLRRTWKSQELSLRGGDTRIVVFDVVMAPSRNEVAGTMPRQHMSIVWASGGTALGLGYLGRHANASYINQMLGQKVVVTECENVDSEHVLKQNPNAVPSCGRW